jgi:hypothetical protein
VCGIAKLAERELKPPLPTRNFYSTVTQRCNLATKYCSYLAVGLIKQNSPPTVTVAGTQGAALVVTKQDDIS